MQRTIRLLVELQAASLQVFHALERAGFLDSSGPEIRIALESFEIPRLSARARPGTTHALKLVAQRMGVGLEDLRRAFYAKGAAAK